MYRRYVNQQREISWDSAIENIGTIYHAIKVEEVTVINDPCVNGVHAYQRFKNARLYHKTFHSRQRTISLVACLHDGNI